MPLYEYECKDCAKRVEVIHDVDEKGPKLCPDCHGKLKRLLGVPGLIFKGSGFYVNDYARKDSGADRAKDSAKSSATRERTKKSDEASKDAVDASPKGSSETSVAATGSGSDSRPHA